MFEQLVLGVESESEGAMARRYAAEIRGLYYITHIDNLASIVEHGILSHQAVEERGIKYTTLYDASIVAARKNRSTPNGRSLWQFANLYFQPRNPMLYRVVHEIGEKDVAVVQVDSRVMQRPDSFLAIGNAASLGTQFLDPEPGLRAIREMWSVIESEWWNNLDGSKRKIMAECLVPERIPPDMLHTVFVASHAIAEQVQARFPKIGLPIVPEPTMFFKPAKQHAVSRHLFLAEGDMFFSNMQTLTVSVNTVGIMGKGLASRVKYQFPDVYVVYQDECRSRALRMGVPFLYRREASLDDSLLDEPGAVQTVNAVKWFLLFATKRHWRDDSDFHGIEEGLRWVVCNYKAQGIESIAMPALGCGLGNLDWRDVGPMMCRHLDRIDIPVTIYLPRERPTPKEYLTAEYLLAARSG